MIGRTISHYKILEKLGEGGMGEVYLAEDTRLHRKAALKFLPTHATVDRESRVRFEREAQAAAALNHPNIVTIYDINEHDGQVYLAMEHIEGSTLRELMNQRRDKGPDAFSINEIVDIAGQLCAGLDKAHQADIVHRDIKPENILIDKDGRVKILDFGIAKLRGVTKLTKESSTLGTIHYMSPEQTRGGDVDNRSDIWSLGVLLYEMVTGHIPFQGDYAEAVIYSILNEDPESAAGRRPDVPAALANTITRSLRKNPEERYTDTAALAADLASLKIPADGSPPAKTAGPGWKKALRYLVLIIALLVIATITISELLKDDRPAHRRLPAQEQVTFNGNCGESVLSPDGSYIAFSTHQGTISKVFVKDLTSGSLVELYRSSYCWAHSWSPDGSQLLISSTALKDSLRGGLYIMPRLGGQPRKVGPTPWELACWSPDGSRIAHITYGQKKVSILNLQTNDRSSFTVQEDTGEIVSLEWSPDGNLLLFQADAPEHIQLWTVRTDGSRQQILMQLSYDDNTIIKGARWAPSGDAVYYLQFRPGGQDQWDLMKIAVDFAEVKTVGEPRVVLPSLHVGGLFFDVSRDGKRLLYTRASRHSNHWLFAVEGEGSYYTLTQKQLTSSTTDKSRAEISPDGRQIVFRMNIESKSNIYSLPLDQFDEFPRPKQLTFFSSMNDIPVWSPDGKEIAFISTQGGTPKIWRMSVPSGTPSPIESSEINMGTGDHMSWAPGSDIIYRSLEFRNFRIINPETGQQNYLTVNDSVGYLFQAHWAPDGRRAATFWNRGKQNQTSFGLWVIDVANRTETQIADGSYLPLVWSEDGLYIYATKIETGDKSTNIIYKIPANGGKPEPYVELPFEEINDTRLSMTPDGRKIVYAKVESQADVWLVENFDPDVE